MRLYILRRKIGDNVYEFATRLSKTSSRQYTRLWTQNNKNVGIWQNITGPIALITKHKIDPSTVEIVEYYINIVLPPHCPYDGIEAVHVYNQIDKKFHKVTYRD